MRRSTDIRACQVLTAPNGRADGSADVRFEAHYRIKTDIGPCPKSADIAKVDNRTTLKISRKLISDFSAAASLFQRRDIARNIETLFRLFTRHRR
jgi:hypothetical protein